MDAFIEKVKETLGRYQMVLSNGARKVGAETWVVAVSGGPDSVALWYSLQVLSKSIGLKLVVAHLNHGLRSQESDDDAAWVEHAAKLAQIPIHLKKVDTAAVARERKLGVEETARALRYEFFTEVAQKSGAVKVATGHNLDDQAETVLMRLVRGAGMDGLGGIPPVNRKGKLTLVRPLIQVSRREILDFLKRGEKTFRIDKSNADLKYRRNFVRHQLIPQIEQEWNPAVKTILARCAEQHRAVYDYIEEESKRWWNRAVRCEKKSATLKGGILKKASPFMRQEIVKRVLRKLAPESSERFHFEHLAQTAQLLTERPKQPKISLPDGVFVEKRGKDLVISVGDSERVC